MTTETTPSVKPAQSTDHSYRFSEQLDSKTGVPVGLVPLEVVREKRFLDNVPFGSTYHDIGAGTGASTRHVLSMVPPDIRRSLSVIASEPYNEIQSRTRRVIADQVREFAISRNDAVACAGLVEADVTSLVNMVHLIPEEDRKLMWERLFESSPDGSLQIISSTFIQNWIPNEYREQVGGFMETWMMRMARIAKNRLSEEEFDEYRRRKKAEKLPLLDVDELVAELTGAGFELVHKSIETMPCTVESYDLIRYDQEWLSFITPGIDPEVACQIQGEALRVVVEAKGLNSQTEMPRNALVLVTRKPLSLAA